ncbi:UNVERIFIED_CONTAM: hypothetical protein HDU68_008816 [Siphonaria sp. JEL0065]|nr:hypothetical protein HDU68_008816 [Siphonaria sp. JEL0065]
MLRQGRTYYTHRYKKAQQESTNGSSQDRQLHPIAAFFFTALKLAAIASVPLLLLYLEQSRADTQAAVAEGLANVVPLTENTPVGSLVYYKSHLIEPDLISDSQFALDFNGAVRVRRNTEYCQWQEFTNQESHTERDDEGNEHTVTKTTYYYGKGWYPHRINSMFFDQPAAHYNPHRDPFPSSTTTSSKAQIGDYIIMPSVLQNANDGWVTRKRYSALELEEMAQQSPASNEVGFKYIGNGYFYSEYEASHTATFIRAAGMALEGSLLDYQMADVVNSLFGQCTAGDLRVSYEAIVVTPENGAAVVGELRDGAKIGIYETSKHYKLGLFENNANTTAQQMFGRLLTTAFWWLLGGYAAACVWAAVVTYYYPWNPLGGVSNSCEKNPSDVYFWTGEAVALLAATVGIAKLLVTDDFFTGLAIVSVGAGLFGVLNSPSIREKFGEEKEKRE